MKERLHPFQIAILIYMIQSGVILFSLPRLAIEAFGTNGWVGIIIIWLLSTINIVLIWFVFKYGKDQSIFEILTPIHKLIKVPIFLFLFFVWTSLGSMVMVKFMFITKMLFFPDLPIGILSVMALIICFILLNGGIYHICKTVVVLFFFTIWTTFLLGFHLQEFSFTRLTPFFFQGDKELIKGGIEVYSAFLGYELSLLFLHILEKRKLTALIVGNSITLFIYFGVTFISFGFFSIEQLRQEMYPLVSLLEYIKIPVLERVENLIFTLFGLKVLITVVMYLWGAKEVIEQIIPKVKSVFIVVGIITISFAMSLYPKIMREVDTLIEYLSYMAIGIAFGLPILLVTIIVSRKLLKKDQSANG
ncbi:GerAB/ArcD/ProY family transporter [Bacillus salitolerans]|uniref:GerAB/ArcD/ProY family transporter n=1 Tax=Bacillus salitolerans TaxID=1437434 RepID=A0ABW4LVA4_9BACI